MKGQCDKRAIEYRIKNLQEHFTFQSFIQFQRSVTRVYDLLTNIMISLEKYSNPHAKKLVFSFTPILVQYHRHVRYWILLQRYCSRQQNESSLIFLNPFHNTHNLLLLSTSIRSCIKQVYRDLRLTEKNTYKMHQYFFCLKPLQIQTVKLNGYNSRISNMKNKKKWTIERLDLYLVKKQEASDIDKMWDTLKTRQLPVNT